MSEKKQINDPKILSENTMVMLKPVHLYSAIAGIITINVIILSFFFNFMNSNFASLKENVDAKVDNAIFSIRNEYLDKEMTEQQTELKSIETSLKTVSNELTKMLIERNNNTSSTTTTVDRQPAFTIDPNRE